MYSGQHTESKLDQGSEHNNYWKKKSTFTFKAHIVSQYESNGKYHYCPITESYLIYLSFKNWEILKILTCPKGTNLHQIRGSDLQNGRPEAPYILLPLRKHLKILCERGRKERQAQWHCVSLNPPPNPLISSKQYKWKKAQ